MYISSLERDAIKAFGVFISALLNVVEMRLFEDTALVVTVQSKLLSTDLGFWNEETVKDVEVEFTPPTFLTTTLKEVAVTDPTAVVLHPETHRVLAVIYFVSVGTNTSAINN